MRFGLCCIFREEPIKFRTTTAANLNKFSRREQLQILNELCLHNAESLLKALLYCSENGIGSFRINSGILPVYTHPDVGNYMSELPDSKLIIEKFKNCGKFAQKKNIRTTFHPDQFVILNSPRKDVVENSIMELEYQAMVAEWVVADVINLHGGGAYGDKVVALNHLIETIMRLPEAVKSRLTLENDDRTYTPADLFPVCCKTGIPLVYDVHHHRCNPDGLSIGEVTKLALSTWNREPLFHISSPKDGWDAKNSRPHHDYINPKDFPVQWENLDITIDIEAKAKEVAIAKLQQDLAKQKESLSQR